MQDIFNNLKDGKVEYLSYRQMEQLKDFVKTKGSKYEQMFFRECFVHRIDPDDIERSTYECFAKEDYPNFLKKVIGPENQKANLEALKKHEIREANEKRKEDRARKPLLATSETLELTTQLTDSLNMIRKINPIFRDADNHTVLLFSLGYALGAMKREEMELRGNHAKSI